MAVSQIVRVRFSEIDRVALREVAELLNMNRSVLIRSLVRECYSILREEQAGNATGKRNAKKIIRAKTGMAQR